MDIKPILKCKKIQDGADVFVDIDVSEYAWPKGGIGICPDCGGKLTGIGKDWTCEACGIKFYGPIF